MQRHFILAVAFAAACTTFSANAQVVNASFTGLVESQIDSGFEVNAPVSGSFSYDLGSASFLSYSFGGFDVASGHGSSAVFSPDQYSAYYSAQLSPVEQGGTLNSTFTLDLEAGIDPWAAASAISLLTDAGQLSTNLDISASTFGFYTGNADGTQIHSAMARLAALTVTTPVPEPGTFALLALGLGALALGRALRPG